MGGVTRQDADHLSWFRQWRTWLPIMGLGGLLLLLLGTPLQRRLAPDSALGRVASEVRGFCTAPDSQWMLAACCAFYFCGLLWWQHRLLAGAAFRLRAEARDAAIDSALLLVTFICSSLWYVAGYPGSIAHGDCVVLLFGMTIGQAIRAFGSHRPGNGTIVMSTLMPALLVILAVAALVRPNMGVAFYYRERLRWTGPWDNPNTFGVLMGAGLVLALGLLWKRRLMRRGFCSVEDAMTQPPPGGLRDWRAWACLMAAGACLIGLVMSFSRGAWVAAGCALIYLAGTGVRAAAASNPADGCRAIIVGRLVPWLGPFCVVLVSIGVLAFWNFRSTEEPLVRRVFSVGNLNDFSWRNRVNSTIGALQIMGDHPLAGLGWNQPEGTYNELYRPFRLTEGMAIVLNDYFVIGMTLGIPAMLCLLAYIWRRFRSGHRAFMDRSGRISTHDWDMLTCRAAFLVLLIGFIPERGLFYLAAGVPFWILLELGASVPHGLLDAPKPIAARGTTDPSQPNLPHDAAEGTVSNAPQPPKVLGWASGTALVIIAFATGLFWADARDPFQRASLSVHGAGGKAVAVRPSRGEPLPMVVLLHSRDDDSLNHGHLLRRMAELGICAVLVEYRDEAAIAAQLAALGEVLQKRAWAKPDAVAVVVSGQGAARLLPALSKGDFRDLRVIVVLDTSGSATPIAEVAHRTASSTRSNLTHQASAELTATSSGERRTHLLLLQKGQPTPEFRLPDSSTPSNGLGMSIEAQPLPPSALSDEQNSALLTRFVAEYCADFFNQPIKSAIQQQNSYWYFGIPSLIMLVGLVRRAWLRITFGNTAVDSPPSTASMAMTALAWTLAILAVAQTAVELGLPRLAVSEPVARVARKLVVPLGRLDDHDFLIRDSGWKGHELKALLEHLELANLQRRHFYPSLDASRFQEFVLSPRIDDEPTEWGWRREFWENFYPRIRKERDVALAAETMVRFLRERVSMDPNRSTSNGVESCWKLGVADEASFERVYVAALRSVGIAARLDEKGIAELWTGTVWQPAPRPLMTSLVRKR